MMAAQNTTVYATQDDDMDDSGFDDYIKSMRVRRQPTQRRKHTTPKQRTELDRINSANSFFNYYNSSSESLDLGPDSSSAEKTVATNSDDEDEEEDSEEDLPLSDLTRRPTWQRRSMALIQSQASLRSDSDSDDIVQAVDRSCETEFDDSIEDYESSALDNVHKTMDEATSTHTAPSIAQPSAVSETLAVPLMDTSPDSNIERLSHHNDFVSLEAWLHRTDDTLPLNSTVTKPSMIPPFLESNKPVTFNTFRYEPARRTKNSASTAVAHLIDATRDIEHHAYIKVGKKKVYIGKVHRTITEVSPVQKPKRNSTHHSPSELPNKSNTLHSPSELSKKSNTLHSQSELSKKSNTLHSPSETQRPNNTLHSPNANFASNVPDLALRISKSHTRPPTEVSIQSVVTSHTLPRTATASFEALPVCSPPSYIISQMSSVPESVMRARTALRVANVPDVRNSIALPAYSTVDNIKSKPPIPDFGNGSMSPPTAVSPDPTRDEPVSPEPASIRSLSSEPISIKSISRNSTDKSISPEPSNSNPISCESTSIKSRLSESVSVNSISREPTNSSTLSSSDAQASGEPTTLATKHKAALFELISTEVQYGKSLRLIIELFLLPVLNLGDRATTTKLFSNLSDIARASSKFCQDLKVRLGPLYAQADSCRTTPSCVPHAIVPKHRTFSQPCAKPLSAEEVELRLAQLRVGDIVTTFLRGTYRMYAQYSATHIAALSYLKHIRNGALRLNLKSHAEGEQQRKLLQIIETAEADPRMGSLNLESFLVKPIQRIMRYPLLLNALLKYMPENHPDREAVVVALRTSKSAAKYIDRKPEKYDTAVGAKAKLARR